MEEKCRIQTNSYNLKINHWRSTFKI